MKKFFLAVVSAFMIFNGFSQTDSTKVKNLFFDIIKYQLTGKNDLEITPQLACLPDEIPKLLMRVHWSFGDGILTHYDTLVPDKTGMIEANFCQGINTENFNVAEFLEKFTVDETGGQELNEDVPQPEENILAKIEENSKSADEITNFLNSREALAVFKFNDEFIVVDNKENQKNIQNSDGERTVRKYVDDKSRLVKKEIWQIKSIDDSSVTRTEEYFYDDDKIKPSKVVSIEGNFKTVDKYNDEGRVIHSDYFADETELAPKNEKNDSKTASSSKRFIIIKNSDFSYDEKNRITEKIIVDYDYGVFTSRNKYTKKTIKEKFVYKNENNPPDYFQYENSFLKTKTEYFSKTDYVITMYFENNYTVESIYENGRRKKDVFYMNGIMLRQKNYE